MLVLKCKLRMQITPKGATFTTLTRRFCKEDGNPESMKLSEKVRVDA